MNRRDIELLISARETTGRSFRAVVDQIEALNRKILEQTEAAEKGEGSLQDLRRTQESLAQAGRDLSSLQGQIDAYRKLAEQQAKNSTLAEQAAADFNKMKTELAGLETVTVAQERKLAGLEKKQRSTAAATEKTTADLIKQTEVLERAGVEIAQLDAVQAQIVNTARAAGNGFVQLGVGIDSFADNVRRAREDEQRFAAQNGFDQKLAQARQLGEATRFVQLYAQAVGTVRQADNQLAALDGFRNVGRMAVEASNDISRFVQAGQTMAVTSSEIATGLRAIIDPGGEALRTLSGVEAAIEKAGAAATAEKNSVAGYSTALNDLSAASAALVRQGGLIDTFRQQEAVTEAVRQKFAQAQAEVQQLGRAMAAADQPTEELARDLGLAEAKLTEVGRALAVEETKLGELSRSLNVAGINTNDLAAAQARLTTAANTTAAAMSRVNATLGRGGQKATGLFGLNPYELQNLSFQINDVFVSLASGQAPLTVLAQQGAQITQIFPGAATAIAKFGLRFAPLIALIILATAVIVDLVEQANRLNDLADALDNVVAGDRYDVAALVDISEKLDDVGVSAEDARKALIAFADEGVDPERLEAYALAAAQLAERLEVDLAEATKLLIDIQTGGIEAAEDLAAKTHDLTVADLLYADALFESGQAAEARQFILDKVAERNNAMAEASEKFWTPAVRNLETAWGNFVKFIKIILMPAISAFQLLMEGLIVQVTFLTGLLAGRGFSGALEDAAKARAKFLGKPTGPAPAAPGASAQDVRDRQFLRDLEAEKDVSEKLTREDRLRKVEIDARLEAQAAGVSKSVEQLAVDQAIRKEEAEIAKEAERAAKKKSSAANKAERAAAAAQRKVDAAQRELTNQLRQLESATGRGDSASLEQRLEIVDNKYASIYETLRKLRSLGITRSADGQSLDAVEQQVAASKERLKAEETIKFFEDQINLLTQQRADEIETITEAQIRGAKTVVQTYNEAAEVNERISPQIVEAARKALEIARAIAGATPSPEMVSLIARLERLIAGEPVSDVVNVVGTDALEQQETKLNKLLSERQDLVEAINTLNELGVISDVEARQRTIQAYQSQATAIKPVVDSLRQTLEFLHQQRDALTGLPLVSDAAYNAWLAKLDAVNAGLDGTNARLETVEKAAEQAIAEGITDAFNTAAQAIYGLISGTKSFGDAIGDIFGAALNLVAKFIQAVAQAIIQLIALELAKKIISSAGGLGFLGLHSGGTVGGMQSGRMVRTGITGPWLGVPKFHAGGGFGLRPDEYKAVLKKGEEVLTEDDPRHIRNLAKGGSEPPPNGVSLQQVLLLDPDAVPAAMQSRSGQRSILTVIRQNAPTIKQMING